MDMETNRNQSPGKKTRSPRKHLPRGLEILYEDDDLLAVDKPAGLLTVEMPFEKTRTAHAVLTDYIRKGSSKSRKQIFPVHRLDQWTSGVLLFAKSQDIKDRLQAQWKDIEKKYMAVVHGRLTPKEGVITSYLAENRFLVVYSTKDAAKGKLAQTKYKVLAENANFSLLEITLLTGRKNQIRVHMADKGHPLAGDRKYGKKTDNFRRLALHSRSICFKHPVRGEPLTVEAPVPAYFKELMAGKSSAVKP
jgi:RluA family pseudouridine synthase